VGFEVGHDLAGVLEVDLREVSSELVQFLSLEIGLLAEETQLVVRLFELAEEEAGGFKQSLHHGDYQLLQDYYLLL
jgi:hypothetical protein